jgi:hypothetical protein
MKALFFALLIMAGPALRCADAPDDPIATAWYSADARQDLGFVLYSYYDFSLEPAEDSAQGLPGSQSFGTDLDDVLGGQGPANDCALVHALWFDLGDGPSGDIQDEIMARGDHMLPILAYGLKQLAQNPISQQDNCGVIVRLDDVSVRELYEDCVKGIKSDAQKRSI